MDKITFVREYVRVSVFVFAVGICVFISLYVLLQMDIRTKRILVHFFQTTMTTEHNASQVARLSIGSENKLLSKPKSTRPSAATYLYHGIDLMSVPPYHFDPTYKNPCWKDQGTLRCLPYFFIVGVQKCGTNALWSHLINHPDVVSPGRKELQWFARGRFIKGQDGFDIYVELFNNATRKIERVSFNKIKTVNPLITGEGSPSYLYVNDHWRYLPGNEHLDEPKYVILDYIQHLLPKAKIIVIFRDPVERLYSQYYHVFGAVHHSFNATPDHFHKMVVMGLRLYNDCLLNRTLRSCVYDERITKKIQLNMQLGIYHVYWRELTRLFPRDQILVLQNRDLKNITSTMMKVFDFLELRPFSVSINGKRLINKRRKLDGAKGDMFKQTRELLEEFYKPHNEEMFRLTGDDVFLYTPTVK